MRNKKAVSPVISTVLLIMIVIILAIIIILWSSVFIKEVILKEIGGESKTIDKFCNDVILVPIINNDDSFGFRNEGNVPIYAIYFKYELMGSSVNFRINSTDDGNIANPGNSVMIDDPSAPGLEAKMSNYDSITIVPILLGEVQSGGIQEYDCPESNGLSIK